MEDLKNEKKNILCGHCGAVNVRIYRPYGTFYRPEDNRCNDCLPKKFLKRGWYVPCITDEETNEIWGYSYVPKKDCERWYNLPEKNNKKSFWNSQKDKWSDSPIK